MRRLSVFVLLIGTVFTWVNGGTAIHGGRLIVAISAEPPSLDWQVETATATRIIGVHIFEGLVTWDSEFRIIPQLAESWEVSDDAILWTFHLRKGVIFHNGKEMSAADVKASLQRFMQVSQTRARLLDIIESLTVIDDYTLQIRLRKPSRLLVALALPQACPVIMPKEIIEGKGVGELSVSDLVGTGPFEIVRWEPGVEIRLKRFEAYCADERFTGPTGLGGKRTAYFDELVFVPVPDDSARVMGLLSGRFDFIVSVPPEDYERLRVMPSFATYAMKPGTKVVHYVNKNNPPLDNLLVRRAILAALNEEEIFLAVTGGHPELGRLDSSLFFIEQKAWYSNIVERIGLYNQNDPALAKSLLKQAGYSDEIVTIVCTADYRYMYDSSLAMAEQLRRVGINVKVKVFDWPSLCDVMFTPARQNEWHIGAMGWSPRLDPSAYYYTFMDGDAGYHNESINELLAKDMRCFDLERRFQIWEDVAKELIEDVGFIVHMDLFELCAGRTVVRGYRAWYLPTFWDVYLED